MTAGAGGSWIYKPKFSLGLVGAASLATPGTFAGVSLPGFGSIPNGAAWSYKVVACIDGAEALRSASSAAFPFVHGGGIGGNSISWAAVAGARCYRIYRDAGTGLFQLVTIAYTNGFIDFGTEANYSGVFLPFGGVAARSSYDVDMAPAVYSPADPRWLERSKASVDGVIYEDLSDVSAMQSFKRSMMAKEFGVRCVVNMTFRVVGGSAEEDDLIAIYGAKLAFPDGPSSIGAQVSFTLASPRATQGFKAVRILGNFSRLPSIGQKNAISVISWQLLAIDSMPTIPAMIDTSGSPLW